MIVPNLSCRRFFFASAGNSLSPCALQKSFRHVENYFLDCPSSDNLIGDGPEAPEVRAVAELLNRELAGQILLGLQWDEASRYHKNPIPGYSEIVNRFPARVNQITIKGKHIIWILEGSSMFYMLTFLGLCGKWTTEFSKHANLRLLFGKYENGMNIVSRYIYYEDQMHYGRIDFYPTLESIVAKINAFGPDVLAYAMHLHGEMPTLPEADHITAERWREKIQNKRISQKEVGVFLLEQKRFSGIGTYLCAEMLYTSRISPYRPLGMLTEVEIERMRVSILEIIYRFFLARRQAIRTFQDSMWGSDSKGPEVGYQIYMRDRCPLGYPVITTKLSDDRGRYWCPSVQT